MTQDVTNPHDSFFKAVFGNIERSRQFFRFYLPDKLATELDLEQLQLEKGSFVDEQLRQRHSDLLFRTVLKNGKKAWIYLLFEHQSTPESDMPFRMLRYLVRIWEQHREQYPNEHLLPFIAPVVLYHGKAPWTTPLFFSQALESRLDLGIHPPELEYILIDLSRIPEHLLRERLELEVALSVFRHIRDEDLFSSFSKILPFLAELSRQETALEYIETILRYVYHVRREDEWNGLIDLFHQTDPIIEEIAMTTIAEHLIQQGLEQGLEKGKLAEAHDVLLELLEEQFGIIPVTFSEKLRMVQSAGVLRMLRRQRKTCQSLEDFERLLEKALQ